MIGPHVHKAQTWCFSLTRLPCQGQNRHPTTPGGRDQVTPCHAPQALTHDAHMCLGLMALQPASWLRTRGPHAMTPRAPTTTLVQQAAQEKLRHTREHRAQSPHPWGHHTMSGEHLPQPLHYDLYYALRTREASACPWPWSSVPTAGAS